MRVSFSHWHWGPPPARTDALRLRSGRGERQSNHADGLRAARYRARAFRHGPRLFFNGAPGPLAFGHQPPFLVVVRSASGAPAVQPQNQAGLRADDPDNVIVFM